MTQRYRDFLRISMTARTGKLLSYYIVEKTLVDHRTKCLSADLSEPCRHFKSGTFACANAFKSGVEIGKKRATLDLVCPFSLEDSKGQIDLLMTMATRIRQASQGQKQQVCEAFERVANEITAYAQRNPMQVIAEAASSRSEPREP